MVWRVLRRETCQPWTGINHKRVQRLWREEGLRRPVRTRKRRRVATGTAERLRAERPNHVWAIDFEFDETADGRRLKLANIVDEYTREALAMRVGRSCTADDLVNVLDDLVADRGAPAHLRADNGPELIAWALREWCRLSGAQTCYIEPGSPWENPYVESFNGRVRDELLNVEEFTSLTVAQIMVEAWRMEYNTYRPHSALDGANPCRVRGDLDPHHPTHTLIASGPPTGVPSGAPPAGRGRPLSNSSNASSDSECSRWTSAKPGQRRGMRGGGWRSCWGVDGSLPQRPHRPWSPAIGRSSRRRSGWCRR
jgi:putative transposase